MKCYFFDTITDKYLGSKDMTPVCGEDFCDSCGDCLSCYGGDPCYNQGDGSHYWVKYIEAEDFDQEN